MDCIYIAPLSKALYNLCLSFTHSHPFTPINITCNLSDAFIQSNFQLIRLSRRHIMTYNGRRHTPWSNVGLRALLKGPTAVQILSWPHLGSNHQPCRSTTLQAAPPFTHQWRLAAMQGTNQLVRSNWGLGVLLLGTIRHAQGGSELGKPSWPDDCSYLLSHLAPTLSHLAPTSWAISPLLSHLAPTEPSRPYLLSHLAPTSWAISPRPPEPSRPYLLSHLAPTSWAISPLPPEPSLSHLTPTSWAISPRPPEPSRPYLLSHLAPTSWAISPRPPEPSPRPYLLSHLSPTFWAISPLPSEPSRPDLLSHLAPPKHSEDMQLTYFLICYRRN